MALQPAGKLEFEQHGANEGGREARHPDQIVKADRARSEQRDDASAYARIDVEVERLVTAFTRLEHDRPLQDRLNGVDDVAGFGDQRAPCLIRSLVPAARGSSGEPGTANTSRPCSAAIRAVISEPERCAASTMTTPTEAPEINRLRRGKS